MMTVVFFLWYSCPFGHASYYLILQSLSDKRKHVYQLCSFWMLKICSLVSCDIRVRNMDRETLLLSSHKGVITFSPSTHLCSCRCNCFSPKERSSLHVSRACLHKCCQQLHSDPLKTGWGRCKSNLVKEKQKK